MTQNKTLFNTIYTLFTTSRARQDPSVPYTNCVERRQAKRGVPTHSTPSPLAYPTPTLHYFIPNLLHKVGTQLSSLLPSGRRVAFFFRILPKKAFYE